jgi:hypothetical protein
MLYCSRLDIAAQDYTALYWTTLNKTALYLKLTNTSRTFASFANVS